MDTAHEPAFDAVAEAARRIAVSIPPNALVWPMSMGQELPGGWLTGGFIPA